MKRKKKVKNSFNTLKSTNNQRQIENMILRNIIKRRKLNNSLSKSRKMNTNSKTHKVITIPLPETNGPNIPKINVNKKCNIFKIQNPTTKLGLNNNSGINSPNTTQYNTLTPKKKVTKVAKSSKK